MKALRDWRKSQGLTAEEAGARIGVSRVHWFRMESGTRQVAAEKAVEVESLTGISRHDLRPDVFGPAPKREGEAAA